MIFVVENKLSDFADGDNIYSIISYFVDNYSVLERVFYRRDVYFF